MELRYPSYFTSSYQQGWQQSTLSKLDCSLTAHTLSCTNYRSSQQCTSTRKARMVKLCECGRCYILNQNCGLSGYPLTRHILKSEYVKAQNFKYGTTLNELASWATLKWYCQKACKQRNTPGVSQQAGPFLSGPVRKLVNKGIHLVCVFPTYTKRQSCMLQQHK